MLLAAGSFRQASETFETLRIEAGALVFGKDIDENRFVMEVGFAPRGELLRRVCFLAVRNRS